ncbi:unnamed protein product [Camellia sinensis]
MFNQMFLHRNDAVCPAKNLYTYEAFIVATKSFGSFGTTSDTATRLKEIAAFLAQTSHETTGSPPDYCVADAQWPCAPGKKYYGYGPIQISYLSPKPSCHDVISERWTPTAADRSAGRVPGFGVITNIINGGIECGHGVGSKCPGSHWLIGAFPLCRSTFHEEEQSGEGLPELEEEPPKRAVCQYGKQTKLPFPQNQAWKATQRLQLIHTDVGGPMKTLSLNGSKYYIAFIDDYSRMCWIYFMKLKSKVIKSDNGTEYTSEKFNKFCKDASIEHQLTTPYTPQQNGVVERKNRKIMEMTRCLLHDQGLPKKFWAEVVNTVVLLLNRLPTKALQKKTPFEAWYDNWSWENDKKLEIQEENDDVDDEPVRGTGSLSNIYQRCNVVVMEPAGYENAATDQKWIAAIKEELKMIEKNQTWELVDRPKHKKAIGVKWVYRTKLNPDGSINKYKARHVVKGYAQMFGVDFSETFAPVARLDTIRMLLALAAQKGWVIHQMDVKSAFLNGYLKEEIFVEQLEEFAFQRQEEKVCRLKKALYGLKQEPRSWYSRIDAHLVNLGFEKSLSESTLYIKKADDEILVVSLYVDDLLVTGSSKELIDKFKEEMKDVFEMTDLGRMTFFLGMQKFSMEECKPTTTPMNQNKKFCKEDGAEKVDERLYGSLIGYLMYLTATKPDIMHAVSLLSSDWTGCVNDMRSTSGYCFSFGSRIFSWCYKKQAIIAQSTAKAKYVSPAVVINQALWIRKLMTDLHMEQQEGTQIFADNQAAISITNNPVFHSKTKHFKIKFYLLREVQREGELQLSYCKTENQSADILTKALPKIRYEFLRQKLSVCNSRVKEER